MLAKNATILTFTGITPETLEAAVSIRPFAPCGASDAVSRGFVPPIEAQESLVRIVDNVAVIAMREDSKVLPASVVVEETKLRSKKFEEQQGFSVGRKQMREIKELVIIELLAKAFARASITRAWFDFKAGLLVVDSSSATKVDSLIGLLCKSLGGDYELRRWRTNVIPSSQFTNWVQTSEPPHSFSIDDRALLKNHEGGGTIRITNNNINLDDIKELIENGRSCVELAMTYDDKFSFVLTKDLVLKRIGYIGLEDRDPDMDEMSIFDAEIILSANAAREAFSAINSVLGGVVSIEKVEAAR
ncbi:recombination-associated protein RdgC [Nitrosomonas sp. Nm132]|uniref:recombination-associated protein RdgC n=1 Tax=Nitrosomonas sp. Nm132 TaxID=1881053 RepID=UPI000884566A|nr:recombination-associated protein RdgC [Nitrosomonas sp. Nm132]SDH25232.1 recombination associated protein RdgC [Nitrosomonas sp. Nm132]